MLLAAGMGMRLRPLTETTPKAMLPMVGYPLIAYGLGLLQRAGIVDVTINLHYLGNQIRDYCKDGTQWGMQIRYSEEPKILGSGGGLKKAAALMGDDPFVAINADTLMDIDIRTAINAFNPAHAGLVAIVPVTPADRYGRISLDSENHLTGFGTGTHTFAGLQIITPKLTAQLPDGASSVTESGYKPLIAAGDTFDTFLYTGYWNDIGTVERYEQTRTAIHLGQLKLHSVRET